jgi:hypothetical protein
LTAALAGGAACAGTGAEEAAEARPQLAGQWALNRELSDDPQEKLTAMGPGAGRMRERGGIMRRGGPGGGGMRRGGGDGRFEEMRARMEEARRRLLEMPATLAITQDQARLTLAQAGGRSRTVFTDRGEVHGEDEEQEAQASWDGPRLVLETRLGDNVKLIETYELSWSGEQLIADIKLEMSMMGRNRSVDVHRVYDRVPTESAASDPPQER